MIPQKGCVQALAKSQFNEYVKLFEQAVVGGVEKQVLGRVRPVPVTPGRLQKRKIRFALGDEIDTEFVLAIDYYGYIKKSRGLIKLIKEILEEQKGKQVKMIDVQLVHFNSIRLEVLARLVSVLCLEHSNIIADFGNFKKAILDAREFNHKYCA